jgi:hypothetical protein
MANVSPKKVGTPKNVKRFDKKAFIKAAEKVQQAIVKEQAQNRPNDKRIYHTP